jgi:two-component system sensor histidine kinase YesM
MKDEKIQEVMGKNANPGEHQFSGSGIANLHARIRIQFGERCGLSIFSREKLFTTVEIRLPAVKTEKERFFHDQGSPGG